MFKILLVNDVKILAEMEKSFLKRVACTILVTEEEQDAIHKAKIEKPDIIVLDSALASFDGFHCCKRLKSAHETKHIPIIFLADPEEKEKCLSSGCDSLVKKPVTRENFVRAILDFLDLKERDSERFAVVKKVMCSLEDSSTVELYTKDLSISGIFLKSKHPLAVGRSIEMDITLGRKEPEKIHIGGEVVRKVEHERDSHLISGMGIRFREMKAADKLRIQEFFRGLPAGKEQHQGV